MLYRDELEDGNVRLTADNGVLHLRTGHVHSEVICKPKNEHLFKENEEE